MAIVQNGLQQSNINSRNLQQLWENYPLNPTGIKLASETHLISAEWNSCQGDKQTNVNLHFFDLMSLLTFI